MVESTVWDTLLVPAPFVRKLLCLPWNLVFPPRVPERYRLDYHIGRVVKLFRSSRTT